MNFMNSKMKLDQKFSGAGGLGKAYAKAFVQAGLVVIGQNCPPTHWNRSRAYVTIGDISEDAVKKIVEELGRWITSFLWMDFEIDQA